MTEHFKTFDKNGLESYHFTTTNKAAVKVFFVPDPWKPVLNLSVPHEAEVVGFRPNRHSEKPNVKHIKQKLKAKDGCWLLQMKLTSIGYYTINVELDQDRFQIFVTVANNGSKTEVMEQAQKENASPSYSPKAPRTFIDNATNQKIIILNEDWNFEEFDREIRRWNNKKRNYFMELIESESLFYRSKLEDSSSCLKKLRSCGDQELQAYWHSLLAALRRTKNKLAKSRCNLEVALQMAQGGSSYVVGDVHYNLALLHNLQGDLKATFFHFEKSLDAFTSGLCRSSGNLRLIYSNLLCRTFQRKANILVGMRYLKEAMSCLQQASTYVKCKRTAWQLELTYLDIFLALAENHSEYLSKCNQMLGVLDADLPVIDLSDKDGNKKEMREKCFLKQREEQLRILSYQAPLYGVQLETAELYQSDTYTYVATPFNVNDLSAVANGHDNRTFSLAEVETKSFHHSNPPTITHERTETNTNISSVDIIMDSQTLKQAYYDDTSDLIHDNATMSTSEARTDNRSPQVNLNELVDDELMSLIFSPNSSQNYWTNCSDDAATILLNDELGYSDSLSSAQHM